MLRPVITLLGMLTTQSLLAGPQVSDCPDSFGGVDVHVAAKLCQLFDDTKPSSMVYHLEMPTSDVVAYYQNINALDVQSNIYGRTLLTNENKDLRVIVSEDGNGSQIDILVLN